MRSQKRVVEQYSPPGVKPEAGDCSDEFIKAKSSPVPRSFPKKTSPFSGWALMETAALKGKSPKSSITRTYNYGDPALPPASAWKEATHDGLKYNLAALRRCRHKLTVHEGGVKKYFQSWCKGHKSNLTRDDIAAGFKELNLGFNDEENDFLVRVFDKDKSNTVEYSEFCKTMELTEGEVMRAVTTNTKIKSPRWKRPHGWHFTPLQQQKASALRDEMKMRIHLSYGSEPQAIRRAFLMMDRDRMGLLSKEDLHVAMGNIGMSVDQQDLDLLMAYYDNSKGDGGVSYSSFVEHFEPEPVGAFNPFDPSSRLHPKPKVHAPDEEEAAKWENSYGRDPRIKDTFPQLYHSRFRPETCPPDFSWRADTVDFLHWKDQGKVVGKAFRKMDVRKALPSRSQTSHARRSTSALPDSHAPLFEPSPDKPSVPLVRASTGSTEGAARRALSKAELLQEREQRFSVRRAQARKAHPEPPPPQRAPIQWPLEH